MLSFFLKPLIIHSCYVFFLVLLFKILFNTLKPIIYPSNSLYQYKIYYKKLSLIYLIIYILVIVLGLYILRLYSMPRIVNVTLLLKNIQLLHTEIFSNMLDLSLFSIFYLYFVLLISVLILYCCFLKLYKTIFRGFFKWFIYLRKSYRDVDPNTKLAKIYYYLADIGLYEDIISYYGSRIGFLFTEKQREAYAEKNNVSYNAYYDQLPRYHYSNILSVIFRGKIYVITKKIIIPSLLICYDSLYNNFIISHIFYYLLIYVPLALLKKISYTCATNAPYMAEFLWNIYYRKEDCIYALPYSMKPILDHYLLSGLTLNPDLGLRNEMEITIEIMSRFEPIAGERSLYINSERALLYTDDNLIFIHVLEDDNGNPIKGEEWLLLADKRKFLEKN